MAPKTSSARVVFRAVVGEHGCLQGSGLLMSFKVIDGDGPGKDERERERERQWAKQEFSQAIREVAANMLRIIRGAGKPYDLLLQMKTAIDRSNKSHARQIHCTSDVTGT